MKNREINFEDILKHEVSNRSLENLKKVMYQQDDFGIKKYKEPLQHYMSYNWLSMAIEEVADFLKYLQCEADRKAYVIQLLKAGQNSEQPKEFIEIALHLLTVEGTGK
ncbi:hypothetical protein V7127_02465 [Bacillus sp. JJ1773]|uniref:hypothetical protein n=1 Tax=Bacillus sp. JJ1773 TaxID=3122965 RepID=UPI003000E667